MNRRRRTGLTGPAQERRAAAAPRRPSGDALRFVVSRRQAPPAIRFDLHLHSCLSPCASPAMLPSIIARRLNEAGIAAAALTDHNSALNAPAFAAACAAVGIHPLFGVEVTTAEEAHILAVFDAVDPALRFGQWIQQRLVPVDRDMIEAVEQLVVTADNLVVDSVSSYLGSRTTLGLDMVCRSIRRRGGLVIPSHIDRPMLSVTSQFGCVPAGPYDAVEISLAYDPVADPAGVRGRWAMIRASDAHAPPQIGRAWTSLAAAPTVAELRRAFRRLAAAQRENPFAGLVETGST